MKPHATNLRTADGLVIYDLDPELLGKDQPAPKGCRWVTDEEWAEADERAQAH